MLVSELLFENGFALCPKCALPIRSKGARAGKYRYYCASCKTAVTYSGDLPGKDTSSTNKETFKVNTSNNTAEISSIVNKRITSEEDLITFCKIDTEKWEVDRWLCNKWEVGRKNKTVDMKWKDGRVVKGTVVDKGTVFVEPLFQIKVWLKKRVEKIEMETIKAEIMADIKKHVFKYPVIKYPIHANGHLLEVDLFDLHFGKLTWQEESGENYDIKIAEKAFMDCITEIVIKAKPYGIEKVLFPIGNDFFNVDNVAETTTRGTKQQEDTRSKKTFRKGRQLIVKAVELLMTIAPVDIIVIPGNHDHERSFYLGDAIECWFHDNPDVTVNNEAISRKYYSYGKVLLGFTHGSAEKPASLLSLMPLERKELWAKSSVREWHLGDQHRKIEWFQKGTQEDLGITIRFLRSLTPPDTWHHENGFIGQVKAAEAFIWNKETGMVSQYYANLVAKK